MSVEGIVMHVDIDYITSYERGSSILGVVSLRRYRLYIGRLDRLQDPFYCLGNSSLGLF
jgi:hypothetical protein